MSYRANLMLKMATEGINKRSIQKDPATSVMESKRKKLKYNEDDVSEPVVAIETCPSKSVVNSINIDINLENNDVCLNNIFPESSNASSSGNLHSTYQFENSFDDSEADPNYTASESNYSDSEIEDMAAQIEQSLNTVENVPDGESNDEIEPSCSKETRKSRKSKRNSGQSYKTAKGVLIPKREMKALSPCMRKCNQKISTDEQRLIFEEYWKMGDYNLRRAYVSGSIKICDKKTARLEKSKTASRNRSQSYEYFLTVSNKSHRVCQKCFRETLGETDKFLKTVIKHKNEAVGISGKLDGRGKASPANKLTKERVQEVIHHIKSFPAYESHYSRKQTSQLYFASDLNMTILYKLYRETHQNAVSLTKFTEIFNTLNIKFKKPHVDTCNTCDTLKIKIDSAKDNETTLAELREEQSRHHAAADLGYESKRSDIALAKQSNISRVLVFDLQQVLPSPLLNSNVSYYKRHLNVYNLTVHDCCSGVPYCYMWHETIGMRGANEIASCVFDHLMNLPSECSSVTLYSDNCFGQNKNTVVATMMSLVAAQKESISHIDHKFLEAGHTHMECDADHSIIEKKRKRTSIQIHHPREWYQFIRTAGGKVQFVVNEMDLGKIKDFKSTSKQRFVFRKTDEAGNKVNWRMIKWLRYSKIFGRIYYKNSLDHEEPFKELNIQKRGVNSVRVEEVPLADPSKNVITASKKRDLLDLLPLVEEHYHDFYRSLPTNDSIVDIHPDLIGELEDDADI